MCAAWSARGDGGRIAVDNNCNSVENRCSVPKVYRLRVVLFATTRLSHTTEVEKCRFKETMPDLEVREETFSCDHGSQQCRYSCRKSSPAATPPRSGLSLQVLSMECVGPANHEHDRLAAFPALNRPKIVQEKGGPIPPRYPVLDWPSLLQGWFVSKACLAPFQHLTCCAGEREMQPRIAAERIPYDIVGQMSGRENLRE